MKAHIPSPRQKNGLSKPEAEPNTCHHMTVSNSDDERVIFFDMDNTLYPKSLGIHNQMAERIMLFFQSHLSLPREESRRLGARFYLDYGLAIRGIMKHFPIDPAVYNEFVDGGLDLESVLKPESSLISWLESLVGRRWIFTNAGLSHAKRVLGLMGIDHLFEGIIYCDYGEPDFPAKPDRLAYERAMKCAGVSESRQCYFVDDSANNVRVAAELGWKAVYFEEGEVGEELFSVSSLGEVERPQTPKLAFPRISKLTEMTNVFPELLRSNQTNNHAWMSP